MTNNLRVWDGVIKCGDANHGGNIALFFKGGCKKTLSVTDQDVYRCVGCGGYFHYDCIMDHFELEEGHDVSRNALKKIKDEIEGLNTKVLSGLLDLCEKGLHRDPRHLKSNKNGA